MEEELPPLHGCPPWATPQERQPHQGPHTHAPARHPTTRNPTQDYDTRPQRGTHHSPVFDGFFRRFPVFKVGCCGWSKRIEGKDRVEASRRSSHLYRNLIFLDGSLGWQVGSNFSHFSFLLAYSGSYLKSVWCGKLACSAGRFSWLHLLVLLRAGLSNEIPKPSPW